MDIHWKICFLVGAGDFTKNNIQGGGIALKGELGLFAGLKRGLWKKRRVKQRSRDKIQITLDTYYFTLDI